MTDEVITIYRIVDDILKAMNFMHWFNTWWTP